MATAKKTAKARTSRKDPGTQPGAAAVDDPGGDDKDIPDFLGEKMDERQRAQYMAFCEATAYGTIDPLSDLGLSMQARYVKDVGTDPLVILKSISENIFMKASDRVAASRALLEYSRRKVPLQFVMEDPDGSAMKISREQLRNLNDKELQVLEALLMKANAVPGINTPGAKK